MSTVSPDWLRSARERLTQEYEAQSAHLAQLTAEPGDAAEAHTRDAMIATTRESLEQLQAALTRISEGRYGKCEDCGEAIPQERLEIRPQARFCVPCQSRRS
jgi:DnaK suppressor protein